MKLAPKLNCSCFDMKHESKENRILYEAKICREVQNELKADIHVYANILKEILVLFNDMIQSLPQPSIQRLLYL